jgi:hypothetical protein
MVIKASSDSIRKGVDYITIGKSNEKVDRRSSRTYTKEKSKTVFTDI